MKKFFTLVVMLVATVVVSSCQKELPDAIKNIDVNKGGQTPTPTSTPTPTPTPDNPTQGDIPTEEDNPWPNY